MIAADVPIVVSRALQGPAFRTFPIIGQRSKHSAIKAA